MSKYTPTNIFELVNSGEYENVTCVFDDDADGKHIKNLMETALGTKLVPSDTKMRGKIVKHIPKK